MNAIKQAWRFIRQWWWAFVVVAATVFAVVWGFMSKSGGGSGGGGTPEPKLPTFADRAKEEAERVRLEGEVEKARVKATADVHRAEIDRIEELGETDPKAARRQLAGWLGRNL